MRILALYPGLNSAVNDVFYVLKHLAMIKDVEILVLTQGANPTKSIDVSAREEVHGRLRIMRPFRNSYERCYLFGLHKDIIIREVSSFEPEVILCSQESNLPLSVQIVRWFGKLPIALVSEYASKFLDGEDLSPSVRLQRVLTGIPTAKHRIAGWVTQTLQAIISCWPDEDINAIRLKVPDVNVQLIPWANEVLVTDPDIPRLRSRAAFAGALTDNKNLEDLLVTLPILFETTPLRQFVVVGRGNESVLRQLRRRMDGRVLHFPGLTKLEVQTLLRSSYFGYTPAKTGSWGFMLDCWCTGTPLVVASNDFGLRPGEDSLLVGDRRRVGEVVGRLYSDQGFRDTLAREGLRRFWSFHTAEVAAAAYWQTLRGALGA